MGFFSQIIFALSAFAVNVISSLGYFGIFILMVLESTAAPVPSELVLPFAGYLVAQGRFNFWLVVLVSGLAGVTGSLISYFVGAKARPFLNRFGKYILIRQSDLEWTDKWFRKHGEKTILIARFVPVVRHLISIPAGFGRMHLTKFIIYTFIGATAWSVILTYSGILLGANYEMVREFTSQFDIYMLLALLALVIWFVWRHLKK